MADTVSAPAYKIPLRLFSALAARASLSQRIGWLFSGDRKIYEILGYKEGLTYRDFKARYVRGDLAHRIVKAFPEETWAQPPGIKEDDQTTTQTAFEQAWETLARRLNVFLALQRTDLLANLGQYAVLLIGLRGQRDLRQPATPVRSPDDVLYLTPYSEEWVHIEAFEEDASQPTFGQPSLYRINFGRNGETRRATRAVSPGLVHASRVIHVAEDLLDDDVYGLPRLEPIFNKLDDLLKVVGGSAEMYYRDAKRRIALETKDGYTSHPDDEAGVREEVDEFIHDLKDWLHVDGVSVKNLSGTVASPKDHFDVLMQTIAGTLGIPVRILLGSERGELASGQDERAWLRKITRRQHQFAEPRMLRPFIDRLLTLGALPQPAQPYQVMWDNLLSLSETEQATIAKDVATAVHVFAQADATSWNPLRREVFVTEYLGLPEDAINELPDLEPGEDEALEEAPPPEEDDDAEGEDEETENTVEDEDAA